MPAFMPPQRLSAYIISLPLWRDCKRGLIGHDLVSTGTAGLLSSVMVSVTCHFSFNHTRCTYTHMMYSHACMLTIQTRAHTHTRKETLTHTIAIWLQCSLLEATGVHMHFYFQQYIKVDEKCIWNIWESYNWVALWELRVSFALHNETSPASLGKAFL